MLYAVLREIHLVESDIGEYPIQVATVILFQDQGTAKDYVQRVFAEDASYYPSERGGYWIREYWHLYHIAGRALDELVDALRERRIHSLPAVVRRGELLESWKQKTPTLVTENSCIRSEHV